jgi:hypothetical protein
MSSSQHSNYPQSYRLLCRTSGSDGASDERNPRIEEKRNCFFFTFVFFLNHTQTDWWWIYIGCATGWEVRRKLIFLFCFLSLQEFFLLLWQWVKFILYSCSSYNLCHIPSIIDFFLNCKTDRLTWEDNSLKEEPEGVDFVVY